MRWTILGARGGSTGRIIVAVLAGLVIAILIGARLNLLLASAGVAPPASAQAVGLGVGTFVPLGASPPGRKRP